MQTSAALTVSTVPWNLMSSSVRTSPTSDVSLSRPGRRSSFPRLPTAFARLVSTTRRPPTNRLLQPCPLGHPEPSRTLIPLANPKVREASQRPDARHRVHPAERNPRARAQSHRHPKVQRFCLSRRRRSHEPRLCSRTTQLRYTLRASTFVSACPPRAFARNHTHPLIVANPGGYGVLGHLSPRGGPVVPLARFTFRTSVPQGCGAAATLVVIDQCQQPTILFS